MKTRILGVLGLALVLVLAWGGYSAWRASRDLVTLNVRNMDVREVVRRIQWQTWERIVVNQEVAGKVTLNVSGIHLHEVLNIVGEQTSSRWSSLYPVYSHAASVVTLKKLIRGELPPETSAWTNFQARTGFGPGRGAGGGGGPGGFGGFGGPGALFGETPRSQNSLVNLHVEGRDLSFAALALSRFSQSQVIPENGATATVNLRLQQVPFKKAVAAVAKQANRKWDHFYALQARPDFAGRRGREGETERPRFFTEDNREERRMGREREREIEFEARLATMTPEEQQKAKDERQNLESLRTLPPEERAQRFEQLASQPEVQQRMQNRMASNLRNSTPAQRVERDRRIQEMRQRRQQEGGGEQPGGRRRTF